MGSPRTGDQEVTGRKQDPSVPPQGSGRTQSLLQTHRELDGGPAREDVVRVKETANDAQLWGDQVCVWGCPPRGATEAGAPGSLRPGGRGINPGSTFLLTLEVRKPEGGGHADVGPRGQPRPRAVPGELEGPGSGAFGGVPRKAECAHSAFPCSGAWTRGHRERTLADGGSADSAGGVARAGSGNPHSHCPQCTRIPLQGK